MPAAGVCRLLPEVWRVNLALNKKTAVDPLPTGNGAQPIENGATGANGPRETGTDSMPPPGVPPSNGAGAPGVKNAREKADSTVPQFTSLVSKVLELADAGVGLGINVVSLLANFAKLQAGGAPAMPQQPPSALDPQPHPAPGPAGEPTPGRNYCIVNRMPLHPGDPVKVSFSINNDMADASKNLSLSCTGFVGATHGFAIPDGVFSIDPASAAIGPMDFERFVLTGVVPAEAAPDSYNGWISVAGDEQLRIPAVLMVN